MSSFILSFSYIILATTMLNSIQLSVGGYNETERLALLKIKAKISNDPLKVMSLWNDTHHFCEWYGVTCASMYEDVTILNLHSAKLTGTLSSHIGNLSSLKVLRLDHNNFGGTIPPEIGRLHSLRTLWSPYNSFGGEIPSNISNCYMLTSLNLISNRLKGNIPWSIGNLSSLSSLHLAHNNFVGKIPESLGKLKNLTILNLEENMLNGTIPSSIFHLSLLTGIYLRQNNLHGNLPSELGNTLPLLKFLYMSFNRFTGHIPTSISNSSNLEALQLHGNKLQGQVPSLHKLTKLSTLGLSNNSLGYNKFGDLNFVSSLSNATSLAWLQIDGNNFNGVLPQSICNFSMLTNLLIHHNNIVGEIPKCIGNMAKMEIFLANDNAISGTLPQCIGKLQNLYLLKLSDNQLTGVIPNSVGNLTKLSTFSLSNNRFEGEIPASLGNCTSLTGLFLGNNTLNGTIPSQLFTLQTLSNVNSIDLTRNRLTGNLPEEVGRLKNIRIFLVTRNKLSGKIPSSLSSCTALEFLYLSKNEFHGTIPDELKALKGLFELDLSYNNLSGEIPPFLASLHLVLLNISHNNLEGKVPFGGVFDNASIVLVNGNSRLCGGIPELKLPQCSSNNNTQKRNLMIVAILCSFFGVIFLVVVFVLLCKLRQRKRTIKKPSSSDYLEDFPNLSYQTLFKATKGFSSEYLIGSGTFGFVYQGILKDGGLKVAIKVFKLEYHGALKSFMAECEILRSIRHRNLLKVITSCSSVDNQGRDFKALVYEYMANGSLENWLHPTTLDINDTYDTPARYLNLCQRLDIALDVALSMDYLHHQCSDPIVHCDIKPSNVLLDDDMVAHVGDFGISKILLQGINDYHGNQSSSSFGVRGTIGYTPPEYGLGKDVTTSGDVYSFGILLLELFTGKRPTNDMFKGGVSLHSFAKNALPHEIATILDHDLLNDIGDEETRRKETALEALNSILQVALSCSAEVPRERLDMNDVAKRLSSIRNTLFTNSLHESTRECASM